ncbi:MAG: DUF5682 family protein [Sandaracinaceae bacterium]
MSEEVEALCLSRAPFLIGVRHHSVALALAMPDLLEAAAPSTLFVELPRCFQPLAEWVGHPDTVPPIALAHATESSVTMLPLAAFSPERVAIAWAQARGIPVVFFDVLVARDEAEPSTSDAGVALLDRWDDLVEARAEGIPEDLRRAGLRVGHAVRGGQPGSRATRVREAHMRAQLEGRREGSVAVVGAAHAPALVDAPQVDATLADDVPPVREGALSLVPYANRLLDARSGYPAGIDDPGWHASRYAEGTGTVDAHLDRMAVSTARALRRSGHAASTDAAVEVVRLSRGLAALRGLAEPGRLEFREGLRAVLGGDGRGFDLAVRDVLIGHARGKLPKGAPVTGLTAAFRADLASLGLPDVPGDPEERRLEVRRNRRDRARHLLLTRAALSGIAYGSRVESVAQGGIEALAVRWRVAWTPNTDATLAVAGTTGVTVKQAASGTLSLRRARAAEDGELSFLDALSTLKAAFEADLPAAAVWFDALRRDALDDATLLGLLDYSAFLARLAAGLIPGFDPATQAAAVHSMEEERLRVARIAETRLEGLIGSEEPEDAVALVRLVLAHPGSARLAALLAKFVERAGPVMRGAAFAAQLLTELTPPEPAARWLASHVDGAAEPDTRRALSLALTGLFVGSPGLVHASPALFDALVGRIAAISDDRFLARLPALRAGFRALGGTDRDRLLEHIEEAGLVMARVDQIDPLVRAHHVELDRAAYHAARAAMGPRFDPFADDPDANDAHADDPAPDTATREAGTRGWRTPDGARLSVEDRVQLVLGRGAPSSTFGQTVALAMENPPLTAGREGVAVHARRWTEELDRLVGREVRQEVIVDRARERPDLLAHLDPEAVRPSADLLAQILEMRGSLGDGALARLRPLIKRVVEQLTRALASEIQPALRGTRTAGWSRRDNGRLHLKRTVERNLRTAYRDAEGTVRLAPDRIAFEALAHRTPPWEVTVLLDVSGSMEPSTVHTAVMAAVLAGVPWLDLRLFAFSTEVIEMTDVVQDPLELLLSVQIGGGTLIGDALAHVAATLRRPPRSLVLCVSDFADGGPPSVLFGAVRALRASGAQLLGLASLDGEGGARYDVATAERLVAAGMPIAALSPDQVARWIKEKVQP